ncbi:MAG: MurR/RpiR family transcriptional regulator [Thermotogota bacterium]|nr:MurR/RpiR family transcriptional regulator [Thermotogota bacterium]
MITEKVLTNIKNMSPVNKKIAKYLLDNKQEFGLSTIDEISKKIAVSHASLVRFSRLLGFSGFYEMKKSIQDEIRKKLNPYEKIKTSKLDELSKEKQFKVFSKNEFSNITQTLKEVNFQNISIFLEKVNTANIIYVSGFGMSRFLSSILAYGLNNLLKKPVLQINGAISDFVFMLNKVTNESTVINYSFPPYSKESFYISKIAKKKNCDQILFTDSKTCPLHIDSKCTFICKNDSSLLTNSLSSPIILTQILLQMIVLLEKEEKENYLTQVFKNELAAYEEYYKGD